MEEEAFLDNPLPLLEAASEFASYPGTASDAAVTDFLLRYPLPQIIFALQTKGHVTGLEKAIVSCLRKIFHSKYGASQISRYMQFVHEGLKANSQQIRLLACETVIRFLENADGNEESVTELIVKQNIYPLLLDCLTNSDEQVASLSVEAIIRIARLPDGTGIIFSNTSEETHLSNLVQGCSSLGRVRVLGLMVKLFSISPTLASAVHGSNLISLLEAEIQNSEDTLVKLNILELFYELTEAVHGTEFLSRDSLMSLFSSMISDTSVELILRSRCVMIIGRLLSNENILSHININNVLSAIAIIDRFIDLEEQESSEIDFAIGALGQIGSTFEGGNMLLSVKPTPARHVTTAAFSQNRNLQLVGLNALGNICGEMRSESKLMLEADAEESLKRLIYEAAIKTSKLTPSGLFLSALQRDSEVRLAAYALLKNIAFRPWCLMEICSKHDIIDSLTNSSIESTKSGMEGRHSCCVAINRALNSSALASNPSVAKVSAKMEEAVRRGPYLAANLRVAQPILETAERV